MLKGHVFKEQIFNVDVFAYFVDTFLNGECGVGNFGNNMEVSYSGSNITVQDGLVCIRGRFIEEDSSTTLSAGTDSAYCKLVIEIDLSKENTEDLLLQTSYKIVKSTSGYPSLTQTDIVKNRTGIYQYELARFKTSTSGISDFQDMRTFLDFDSIYEEIRQTINAIKDESIYALKTDIEEKTLFESETSETSFNLSDDATNYKRLIFYNSNGNKIGECLGTSSVARIYAQFESQGYVFLDQSQLSINGTKCEVTSGSRLYFAGTGWAFEKTTLMGVAKVVGYKN